MAHRSERKKPKSLEENEYRLKRWYVVVPAVAKIISEGCKWFAILGIVYFVADAVKPFAGKVTLTDINASVDAFGLKNLGEALKNCITVGVLGLMVGTGGILYGRRESRLRRDAVERLHYYQLKWEQHIDPKRTSSTLTPTGDTRPEDQ